MKYILGLEVCDDNIKLICGSYFKNSFIIKNYKTVRFNDKIADSGFILDADRLIKEIYCFILDNSIKCKKINVLLNSPKIVVRNIKANLKNENEAQSYVNLNANNILPIDISNGFYTDFKVDKLFYDSSEKLFVTIAAVPIELVEQYVPIFNELKLKPVLIDIYENSIARVFENISLEEEGVIVTLDFYSYCLQVVFLYHRYVIHRLYIKFNSNVLNILCNSILEDEVADCLKSLFINKLKQYVNSYNAESLFGEIKAFYLLGEIIQTEALQALLFDEFGILAKFPNSLYYEKNNVIQMQGIIGALYFKNNKK